MGSLWTTDRGSVQPSFDKPLSNHFSTSNYIYNEWTSDGTSDVQQEKHMVLTVRLSGPSFLVFFQASADSYFLIASIHVFPPRRKNIFEDAESGHKRLLGRRVASLFLPSSLDHFRRVNLLRTLHIEIFHSVKHERYSYC